jgi:hypothetical protein
MNWGSELLPGGIYANVGNVADLLNKLQGSNAETAKVFEGTDQNGKIYTAVVAKGIPTKK